MRPYVNDETAAVIEFPGAALTLRKRRNPRDDYSPVTETGVVPGAGNEYSVVLDQRILPGAAVTVLVGGVEFDVVPLEEGAGTGEAAVGDDLPIVTLPSANVGAALSVTYTPMCTMSDAEYDGWIEGNLRAVEVYALALGAAAAHQVCRLGTVAGVNAKTVAASTLWTADAAAEITGARIRCTAASAITVPPQVSITRTTGGAATIFEATSLTGLTAAGKNYVWVAFGAGVSVASGDVIQLNVTVAATGTSQTIAGDLLGYK